jgi:hypothetical protein
MKKMPIHATYVVQPLFLLVLLPPTVSSCFEMHHTRNPQNDNFAKPQEDGSMFTFFFLKKYSDRTSTAKQWQSGVGQQEGLDAIEGCNNFRRPPSHPTKGQ